jgi:uncharacterized protein YdhG (YjbR/CyaY superfamily)
MMTGKQPLPKDIDAYITGFPQDIQEILEKIRAIIHKAAPEAEEAIKYAIPTFTLDGNNLVHFAAFQHHIGFYPTPSGTEKFKEALSAYAGAKGSVRFPFAQPIPYELVNQITKFRVAEVQQKLKNKSKKKKAASAKTSD